MARLERPLDPGPLQSFAHELRELRSQAGSPTYAQLARRTGYAASTLSQAASGKQLPSWDVTSAYVVACGGDPEQWEQRWQALTGEPEPESTPETPRRKFPVLPVVLAVAGVVIVVAALAIYLPQQRQQEDPAAERIRRDFEQDRDDWGPMWGKHVRVSVSSQQPFHGKSALSVTVLGDSRSNGASGVGTDSGLADLKAGMTVNYWVWSPGNVNGSVQAFARDAKFTNHPIDQEKPLPMASGWFRMDWKVPAIDDVTSIALQVNNYTDGDLTVMVDAVSW